METLKEPLTEAIRISLKSSILPKFLVPACWSFDLLQEYLQTLLSNANRPLLFRNHHLYDETDGTLLKEHLGETFDCHFTEEKQIFRLKLEKLLFVPEETLLPLLLTSH